MLRVRVLDEGPVRDVEHARQRREAHGEGHHVAERLLAQAHSQTGGRAAADGRDDVVAARRRLRRGLADGESCGDAAKIKAWPPTCFHIVRKLGSASCLISIPSSLLVGGAVQAETTEPYMPPTPAPTIVFMIKPGLSAPMVLSRCLESGEAVSRPLRARSAAATGRARAVPRARRVGVAVAGKPRTLPLRAAAAARSSPRRIASNTL